ncbi:PHEX [Lepeophtheirus salmonis]|uniref:PHEX n=1 Tax=Lepeophtheirus salmonis TaxID=72036 RepID=A0A817FED9_LEPSM|nr:PHEX [Lepeophtheirus salmonis]CAG9477633.1 PHEX [Lepeophtheirus salmonis]
MYKNEITFNNGRGQSCLQKQSTNTTQYSFLVLRGGLNGRDQKMKVIDLVKGWCRMRAVEERQGTRIGKNLTSGSDIECEKFDKNGKKKGSTCGDQEKNKENSRRKIDQQQVDL